MHIENLHATVFGAAVGKRDQEILFLIINGILCKYTLALLV